VTRRVLLQGGAAAAGSLAFGYSLSQGASGKGKGGDKDEDKEKKGKGKGNEGDRPSPRFTPFTQDLPIPPVLQPLGVGTPPYRPGDVFHGIAPEFADLSQFETFPTKYYQIQMRPSVAEILPGVRTPVWGYNGLVPGPTIKARIGEPAVVRFQNQLPVENSVHFHGGHTPAHADGYPNFYVLPGKARDYFYPNTVPRENGELDFTESISTGWYHDHAMDITAENVLRGLSGFYLTYDDLERNLINSNVLPADAYDIPLSIQDRRFNPDGTIFFDPLDHDGYIGDVFVVNGKAQPRLRVQRRKYRFRILDGSNARFYELRLSNGQPFTQIGMDSWLYPFAIERNTLLLSPAKRADVIIDFTNAPNELFLNNILEQDDGRGPDGDLEERDTELPGTPLLKFIVEGPRVSNNASIRVGDALRPHRPIRADEIVQTRTFEFDRRQGAWQINNQFFNPDVANATPTLGTAERWILRNGGGGWWHPIHIHLESHQQQRLNGRLPPIYDRFKTDTTILGPGDEVEIFMKFRTFTGPFVFHCHNVEHEDMRMMFAFDPRRQPTRSPAPIQVRFP
jgi:FtsP/CotA-like multicopper oxidase with cupredoxin domain